MSFLRDLKVAAHSLIRTPGLAITVILTLALGIGANAAIFTLVRGVLLKPLVNRDENRLMYIRQSASSAGEDNTTFSVPEIKDIQASVHAVSEFGDFSTMSFTMIGLGEPRGVQGGVVGGTYFEVMVCVLFSAASSDLKTTVPTPLALSCSPIASGPPFSKKILV
jgi:putative ABC transport system permease protein